MSSLVYTGANGLFTRLGKIVGMMKVVRAWQNVGGTLETSADAIIGEFDDPDLDWVAGVLADLPTMKGNIQPIIDRLRLHALAVLAEMIHEIDPLPAGVAASQDEFQAGPVREELRGLSKLTVLRSLTDLMVEDTESFDQTTVSSATAAAALNTGDGKVLVLNKTIEDEDAENLRAEDIRVLCIADARGDVSKQGIEQFSVRGEAAVPDHHPDWPQGSGVKLNLNCSGSTMEAGRHHGDNMLVNSGFGRFATANKPDNWDVEAGVVGDDIKETSTPFRGKKALHIRNESASPLTELRQNFDDATVGTSAIVRTHNAFLISAWLRHDGTVLTGNFDIEVFDDTGNIVSKSINLATDLSATYQNLTAAAVLTRPTLGTVRARMQVTTSPAVGRGFFIDELIVTRMLPVTLGGPFLAIVPGAINWLLRDLITVTMTNNNEGEWIREMDRLLGLLELGVKPPTAAAAAETILDSLIS